MVVLIGYGPTDEGRAALNAGLQAARDANTRAVVVFSQRRGDRSDGASEQVEALRAEVGGADVEVEIREPGLSDDPVEELLDAAQNTGADLIVIGLRRRTPVGKLILGSNAQRILLDAACPVLAVKASA